MKRALHVAAVLAGMAVGCAIDDGGANAATQQVFTGTRNCDAKTASLDCPLTDGRGGKRLNR